MILWLKCSKISILAFGRLAQLVEHLLDVQRVSGSSPVSSTKKTDFRMKVGFFILWPDGKQEEIEKCPSVCAGGRWFLIVVLRHSLGWLLLFRNGEVDKESGGKDNRRANPLHQSEAFIEQDDSSKNGNHSNDTGERGNQAGRQMGKRSCDKQECPNGRKTCQIGNGNPEAAV